MRSLETAQTYGDFVNWNPHLHCIVTDGGFTPGGVLHVLPRVSLLGMEELFRHRVLKLLLARGFSLPAGVDEVGRGPLAGPVVAAAVILDPRHPPVGVTDSKLLSPRRREELDRLIRSRALAVAVAEVDAAAVDELDIHRASWLAMERAVAGLDPAPDVLLVDGLPVTSLPLPHWPIVGGDRRCRSVAAASIVAKVHRDALMDRWHAEYPVYGFDRNKGYGTDEHRRAIERHGPCPLHRRTFAGVREHASREIFPSPPSGERPG